MARKDDSSNGMNVSRRNFLKSTGVVTLAATVVVPAEAAQSGPAAVGPGEVPVRLNVNGRQIDLMIEPRVTLLDALRMRANLTGNKRGCDRGACGACTMIVDGRPVYSCSTLAIEVQGKQIRNVDGLAKGDKLHPVQQAFCDNDALMCGFCTPGFIMASVGLLEKNPNPTPEEIKKGLDGNICRCGTFPRIFEAVSSVRGCSMANRPEPARQRGRGPSMPPVAPEFDWPAKPEVIGTHVKRVDGPDKVSGRAKYTFDISRPGMLYARVVRSPYPHARVVSVDLSAALRAPGVKAALVWRDPSDTQNNRAMFQGDEVAAVAADTEERAIDAARLIKVQYEVLPHVTEVSRALDGTAPEVFTGGNVRPRSGLQQNGDLAAGFQSAAHTIDETYSCPVITHVCMETHGTVCEWDGDKLTAWISTQGINAARENFASALGIPQANVRVICQYMGGGFGSKALERRRGGYDLRQTRKNGQRTSQADARS